MKLLVYSYPRLPHKSTRICNIKMDILSSHLTSWPLRNAYSIFGITSFLNTSGMVCRPYRHRYPVNSGICIYLFVTHFPLYPSLFTLSYLFIRLAPINVRHYLCCVQSTLCRAPVHDMCCSRTGLVRSLAQGGGCCCRPRCPASVSRTDANIWRETSRFDSLYYNY